MAKKRVEHGHIDALLCQSRLSPHDVARRRIFFDGIINAVAVLL